MRNPLARLRNSVLLLSGLAAVSSASARSARCEFGYFGSGIDYWHDSQAPKFVPAAVPSPRPSVIQSEGGPAKPFDWQKYMDPKNKEFFQEGDYTPPASFMETMRDPSDQNLKMWFAYIQEKNELANRLGLRMKEYLEKKGLASEPVAEQYVNARVSALPKFSHDAHRFRFRMYFDSHCPHCRKMFGTLAELRDQGFDVDARQIDQGPLEGENQGIPVEKASVRELQDKEIQSVPLLLVGDLEKKTVYRLTGYRSAPEIFRALEQGGTGN